MNSSTTAAKDDLRNYAYEGEGSSASSLTSAISGQTRSDKCYIL